MFRCPSGHARCQLVEGAAHQARPDDPQVRHPGVPEKVEHPWAGGTRIIGSGVNISETPTAIFRPAPLLGEHTAVVIEELGFAADRIEELRRRRVV